MERYSQRPTSCWTFEALLLKEARLQRRCQAVVFVPGSPQLTIETGDDGSEHETFSLDYTGADMAITEIHLQHDIAVVGIKGEALPQHHMSLNADLAPVEGDPVATCGWPYGMEMHERKTILSSFLLGTVSAVVPHPKLSARARLHYLMQLPVNPGNSGGGVFDPDTGDLFGVVSSRYEPGGIPSGLSVIIPAYHAEPAVTKVLKHLAKTSESANN